jgi:hypothetical protein
MWQKSRSCSSAGLSFTAKRADSRQGLHRKLRCQSCGKRAGPARLPAQNWSVATKICIECVKVNHLANDHAISLLDYNSQRHFNLRKALFSVMWQMSTYRSCLSATWQRSTDSRKLFKESIVWQINVGLVSSEDTTLQMKGR